MSVIEEMKDMVMKEGFGDFKHRFRYEGVVKKHSILWGNDTLYINITLVEPYDSIIMDRIVRSLCDKCKIEYTYRYNYGRHVGTYPFEVAIILVPVECYRVIVPIIKKYMDELEIEIKDAQKSIEIKITKDEEELNELFKQQIGRRC
jgi:hypothetical protein